MDALHITGLKKQYKNHLALKDINLTIREGDFFALLWVNGAGKTTLIGILSDLVVKTHGTVRIFDTDIDQDFSRAKKYIGIVPQEFNLDIFSKVEDVLIMQAGYFGIKRSDAEKKAKMLLEKLSLADKAQVQVRMLSGGMKRRLMIARALMHDPKLLILDEPTAGVDINLRKATYEFLQELNSQWMTILLTTHYLEEVEKLCNTLAVIKDGYIIEQCSKQDFFAKMTHHRFEIEVKNIATLPEELKKFYPTLTQNILSLQVEKNSPLWNIFEILQKHNIEVLNVKNTTNELESLFESLTQ